jgi:hypothetical protein
MKATVATVTQQHTASITSITLHHTGLVISSSTTCITYQRLASTTPDLHLTTRAQPAARRDSGQGLSQAILITFTLEAIAQQHRIMPLGVQHLAALARHSSPRSNSRCIALGTGHWALAGGATSSGAYCWPARLPCCLPTAPTPPATGSSRSCRGQGIMVLCASLLYPPRRESHFILNATQTSSRTCSRFRSYQVMHTLVIKCIWGSCGQLRAFTKCGPCATAWTGESPCRLQCLPDHFCCCCPQQQLIRLVAGSITAGWPSSFNLLGMAGTRTRWRSLLPESRPHRSKGRLKP